MNERQGIEQLVDTLLHAESSARWVADYAQALIDQTAWIREIGHPEIQKLHEGVLELLPEIPDDYGEFTYDDLEDDAFTFDDIDRQNIRKAVERDLIPDELPSNEYMSTAIVQVLRDAYADGYVPRNWTLGKDRADLAAWFIVTVLAPIAARLSVEGKL